MNDKEFLEMVVKALVENPADVVVDRTVDEMAHAWMNVVYLNDAEYTAALAERKARVTQTATNERP